LRLGYDVDLLQAPVLAGIAKGLISKEIGTSQLKPVKSDGGPDAIAAVVGGSLDAAFVDPAAAIEAYTKSNDIKVIAGTAARGAELLVRRGIAKPEQLIGKTVATPRAGGPQDIALKKWLAAKKLTGKVKVTTVPNAHLVTAFKKGTIDGAWAPEPWASRLVDDAGAATLVDEATLWPERSFPTTVLIARTQLLQEHPATATGLLTGLFESVEFVGAILPAARSEAKTVVNAQLKLPQTVLDRAFLNVTYTVDPGAAELRQLAKDEVTAGIRTTEPNIAGIADLAPLNAVLDDKHAARVDPAGLDQK
jgi:NitT/TauT family transport system substrate-binding protein